METNLEKAKRQLKDHAAISGIELPENGFIMKMLDLAATPYNNSLFSDSEMIDWLHLIMSPDSDYCEVFFAGLRNFKTGYATAFQVESNPEKFKTVNAPTLREAITLAMIKYNNP